jgi:hypothetical protein
LQKVRAFPRDGDDLHVSDNDRTFLTAVAIVDPCTLPQNDRCADPIDADILLGWRLLGERRLSALGECSSGGDALATVATFTALQRP